jgi:adenylylsulfate kinase|tara:strand:- start:117 stop:545 length:429 start_codon:yes stop_codon:yes gene_type:complete
MKILIMGLPGSGKTWLAERLQKRLNCAWFNADKVREMANDWEFSEAARLRQAYRMQNIADYEIENNRTVIADFVCPLEITREIFDADYIVWMDTISRGRYEDTNDMFQTPEKVDYHVEAWFDNTDEALADAIARHIRINQDV